MLLFLTSIRGSGIFLWHTMYGPAGAVNYACQLYYVNCCQLSSPKIAVNYQKKLCQLLSRPALPTFPTQARMKKRTRDAGRRKTVVREAASRTAVGEMRGVDADAKRGNAEKRE